MPKDWLEWHLAYDEPGSALHLRLATVQRHIRRALATAAPGPIRVVSVCAGQGRDLLGVLADHPRRDDVSARLVELDPQNAKDARAGAGAAGLRDIEVVQADAALTDHYEGAVPADLLLVCGVFGNITDDDIHRTIDELPHLSAVWATVIWTRYPRDPALLPQIDRWFQAAGFAPVALETGPPDRPFGVGVHRYGAEPKPFRAGVKMFTFLENPDPTRL